MRVSSAIIRPISAPPHTQEKMPPGSPFFSNTPAMILVVAMETRGVVGAPFLQRRGRAVHSATSVALFFCRILPMYAMPCLPPRKMSAQSFPLHSKLLMCNDESPPPSPDHHVAAHQRQTRIPPCPAPPHPTAVCHVSTRPGIATSASLPRHPPGQHRTEDGTGEVERGYDPHHAQRVPLLRAQPPLSLGWESVPTSVFVVAVSRYEYNLLQQNGLSTDSFVTF